MQKGQENLKMPKGQENLKMLKGQEVLLKVSSVFGDPIFPPGY